MSDDVLWWIRQLAMLHVAAAACCCCRRYLPHVDVTLSPAGVIATSCRCLPVVDAAQRCYDVFELQRSSCCCHGDDHVTIAAFIQGNTAVPYVNTG